MKNTLKSEFRKLLTVRSTYLVTISAVLLFMLMFGYGEGYRGGNHFDSRLFSNSLLNMASFASFFAMIIGILMMGHEYRYNTIIHTLVNSNSRTKVLVSKITVLVSYSLFLALLLTAIALGGIMVGSEIAGKEIAAQDIDIGLYVIKAFFFTAATGLAGMLFATLIRNMIAAFAIFLILPNFIEIIGNLIIKEKSVYLPFSALNEVIITVPPDLQGLPFVYGDLSPLEGALVFLAYLVPAWLLAWLLFLRRDATT